LNFNEKYKRNRLKVLFSFRKFELCLQNYGKEMTKAEWIHVVKVLLTSRLMDSIEENELAPKGKVLYQFSARGHELGQIILAQYLNHAHDAATVYYRSRPFVLAAGMTIEEGFAGPLAKKGSRNGGRDIGVVHNLVPRSGPTVLPASGDVGAQYTPAVGWAQAIVYRSSVMQEKNWHKAVAVALGGDASCATNGFWSALTIATTKNYPMVFFIEDNNYGISVPGEFQTPGANIAANLASFNNLLVLDGDGTDPETADALIKRAVQHARTRLSPVLLRLTVPRICGHSGADNQSYKSQETISLDKERDPLYRLQEFILSKKILSKNAWAELEAEVESTVRQELEKALAQPDPEVDTIKKYALNVNKENLKILEIGTATGFTAFTMSQVCSKYSRDFKIDTIEKNPEHTLIAAEQFLSLRCANINIIEGKAEEIIQNLKNQSYDIIFFDAFAPKEQNANEFDRILKNYGILISANSFLRKTETGYFEYFTKHQYAKIDEFDDTKIWQKKINKNIKKNLNLKSFRLFF
jgi:TPP-dependent pyruvate/acetoin dehydrogenase alpha subunit